MKNLKIIRLFILTCFAAALFSSTSFAEDVTDPTALVSSTITEARDYILANQGKLPEEKLQKDLEQIIFPAFDFREMARRSLGKNWKKSTEDEQKEFVDLFSELISKTYQKRVVKHVAETEFSFVDQRVEGKRAIVKSKVEVDGDKVDVDYRLKRKEKGWKVYDIIIANVSLVSNYRSEFSSIVRKDKMSGLISKLREKKNDNDKKDS